MYINENDIINMSGYDRDGNYHEYYITKSEKRYRDRCKEQSLEIAQLEAHVDYLKFIIRILLFLVVPGLLALSILLAFL